MMEPWEIYLEYSSRKSSQVARDLVKKQFWMRPYNCPLVATVTIVSPHRSKPNAIRIARKLLEVMEGVLWEKVTCLEEIYVNLRKPDKVVPTSRIVIKFWKREAKKGD